MAIIKELSTHKHLIIRSYLRKLKEEIILLDVLVNDASIDRFVEYLKTDCL